MRKSEVARVVTSDAFGGSAAILLLSGAAIGVTHGLRDGHLPAAVGDMVSATAAQIPATWLIVALGTALFGHTEFGVRIVGCMMMLGASGLLYYVARQWFGRTAGVLAALSRQVLPAYFASALTATNDAPLPAHQGTTPAR